MLGRSDWIVLFEVMGVSVYPNAVVNVFISGNHHSTKISVFKNKENYFKIFEDLI